MLRNSKIVFFHIQPNCEYYILSADMMKTAAISTNWSNEMAAGIAYCVKPFPTAQCYKFEPPFFNVWKHPGLYAAGICGGRNRTDLIHTVCRTVAVKRGIRGYLHLWTMDNHLPNFKIDVLSLSVLCIYVFEVSCDTGYITRS